MVLDVSSIPALPTVIFTALVDAVNPCAIGVLILLIATLLSLSKNRNKLLAVGLIYISAVFLTYLLAGFGLLIFIQKMDISTQLSWIVGVLVIVLGLIEIKDFFWYGKGISLQIPKKRAKQVMKMINNISIPGSIILGIFVAAVELPCTGGPYLAITTLLAKLGFSWNIFWLLVLYNFIFVLPLIIILGLVYFGANTGAIKNWKDSNKKWMRLFMGIILLALGALLLFWANGNINFAFA
jgi:cytochrome c biogenesis protein CcdA